MTDAEALNEARRRWGQAALIERRTNSVIHDGRVADGTHSVGRMMHGDFFFEVWGSGSSWEHAFAMCTWMSHSPE